MNKIRCIVAVAVLFALTSWALAEEPQLPVLKTKPQTIAVFKNGLGFFTREGEVRLVEGWAVADEIPQASLGSLWIAVLEKDARLEQLISFKNERSREKAALSVADLFKANIGKKVAFTMENKLIEGKIKAVPGAAPLRTRAAEAPEDHGTLVILETSKGDVAINKNLVNTIHFLDVPVTTVPDKETVPALKFKIAPPRDKARIGLFYLQKGISWTPAYLVNIVDDKKLRITMQALLVNDIEDFEETDLFFVVGYPHFIFSDILSPLAQGQTLAQFMSALAMGGRREMAGGGQLLNIAVQRIPELEEGVEPGVADYLSAGAGVEGASTEDLFFYRQPGVSLKKGERALYPIFSEAVDYSTIYEWTVPDMAMVDSRGEMRRSEAERTREQVWHSLKMKNSTAYPWTTAPALAVRDGKPLAQEILDYTSKGTSVNLRLTIASDVRTARQELEAERQRDVTLYDHSYDLVTVKGELKVKNNKDKAITMDIRKAVTGEVIEASHNGKAQKIAEGLQLRAVNPNSRITWEIVLDPHQEIALTYKYKIYVSH